GQINPPFPEDSLLLLLELELAVELELEFTSEFVFVSELEPELVSFSSFCSGSICSFSFCSSFCRCFCCSFCCCSRCCFAFSSSSFLFRSFSSNSDFFPLSLLCSSANTFSLLSISFCSSSKVSVSSSNSSNSFTNFFFTFFFSDFLLSKSDFNDKSFSFWAS